MMNSSAGFKCACSLIPTELLLLIGQKLSWYPWVPTGIQTQTPLSLNGLQLILGASGGKGPAFPSLCTLPALLGVALLKYSVTRANISTAHRFIFAHVLHWSAGDARPLLEGSAKRGNSARTAQVKPALCLSSVVFLLFALRERGRASRCGGKRTSVACAFLPVWLVPSSLRSCAILPLVT